MPTASAMSRSLMPGSLATHRKTWAWLERKSQRLVVGGFNAGIWILGSRFMNKRYTVEPRNDDRGGNIVPTITDDQVVEAAKSLSQPEFTRSDIADKLGVEKTEFHQAFKAARKSGRLEKVRDDNENVGHFRLTAG
jgi:hypothetical protein